MINSQKFCLFFGPSTTTLTQYNGMPRCRERFQKRFQELFQERFQERFRNAFRDVFRNGWRHLRFSYVESAQQK